jgi:hypothetical protein
MVPRTQNPWCTPEKKYKGAKTLSVHSHTRTTLTPLSWKWNRVLLRRPLFVAEYREKNRYIWSVKSISTKSTFCVSTPTVRNVIVLHIPPMQFSLRERVSTNCWNLIKIVVEKIATWHFGTHLRSPIFGVGMIVQGTKYKFKGVRSGERGGYVIVSRLPVHFSGNL